MPLARKDAELVSREFLDMQTFTRTATAVVLATLATAASAQGFKPVLFGLKPNVAAVKPTLVRPNLVGVGIVSSRAEADAIRAAAQAQAQAARAAAQAARDAARAGR